MMMTTLSREGSEPDSLPKKYLHDTSTSGFKVEEAALPAERDPMSVPDGGLKAWTTIAGA
jgi:hypothetical protein